MNWKIELIYCLLFTVLTGSLFWAIWKVFVLLSDRSSSLITVSYRLIPFGFIFFCIPIVYISYSARRFFSSAQDDFVLHASPLMNQIALAITAIWLTGVFIGIFIYLTDFIRLKRIQKNCTISTDSNMAASIQQLTELLKLRRTPVVYNCPSITSPAAMGCFRTALLIPECEYTVQELYPLLLHELTHLKHHDLPKQAIGRWITIVFWFFPVSWLFCHDIKMVCEYACDQTVLSFPQDGEKHFTRIEYFNLILSHLHDRTFKSDKDAERRQSQKRLKPLKRRMRTAHNSQKRLPFFLRILLALICLALMIMIPILIINATIKPVVFVHNQLYQSTIPDETDEKISSGSIEYTEKENESYWREINWVRYSKSPESIILLQSVLHPYGRYNSSLYHFTAGTPIQIIGGIEPVSSSVRVGISNGKEKCYVLPHDNGIFYHTFIIPEDGDYIIFMENRDLQNIFISFNAILRSKAEE